MATLFLPQVVLNVPQFIMFSKMGWVDSKLYLPIIVPTLFATDTLFVFQLIQFLRNVPKELDEAAKIDGCNAVQTLVKVIVPMLSPAITSIALFQFMWSSNDFMGPLLYVNTPGKISAGYFRKNVHGCRFRIPVEQNSGTVPDLHHSFSCGILYGTG